MMDPGTHSIVLAKRGAVRRSMAVEASGRCVACATGDYQRRGGGGRRMSDRPRPRYCTCPGYARTAGLPEQCAACLRRIHPRYDATIGIDPVYETE